MPKQKKSISEPRSRFLLVKCNECEHEQIVFGSATQTVACEVCGKPLSKSTGGKAKILGEILQELS